MKELGRIRDERLLLRRKRKSYSAAFAGASKPWSSLPGLKRTAFPGGMFTSSPVRGLRPMPVLRGLTLNTPKRRNSIRCPRPRALFNDSKTVSTACSALVRLMFGDVALTTALTMSNLITHSSSFIRGQMLEGTPQVVKTWRVIYTWPSFSLHGVEISDRDEEVWMSVKPDKWIRRMSLEHKMIEPL